MLISQTISMLHGIDIRIRKVCPGTLSSTGWVGKRVDSRCRQYVACELQGFAFVHFNSEDAVQLAIAKNQTALRGRPLVIQQSQPMQARGGGGRGAGRSGRDDSGRGARGRGRGRGGPPSGGDHGRLASGSPSDGAAGRDPDAAVQGGNGQDGGQAGGSLGRGAGNPWSAQPSAFQRSIFVVLDAEIHYPCILVANYLSHVRGSCKRCISGNTRVSRVVPHPE